MHRRPGRTFGSPCVIDFPPSVGIDLPRQRLDVLGGSAGIAAISATSPGPIRPAGGRRGAEFRRVAGDRPQDVGRTNAAERHTAR